MLRTQRALITGISGIALLSGASPPPSVLSVPSDGVVKGSINGVAARLIMTADGLSYPVLAPRMAEKLSLSSSIFTVQARIGPVKIPGRAGIIALSLEPSTEKRRALWFEKPAIEGADAALGPESVPHSVVTFRLRPEQAGERKFALPLARMGARLGTLTRLGRTTAFVQWDLRRSTSLATAAAANDLAISNGARREGPARGAMIRFGVERPVRSLTLPNPLTISPIRIGTLDARVPDYGNVGAATDSGGDPDEIIVVAKKGRDKPEHVIIIGRNDLSACSSISFDKASKQIRLSCL